MGHGLITPRDDHSSKWRGIAFQHAPVNWRPLCKRMCAIWTIWGMSMQHSCMTVHKFKFRNTCLLADVALKARVGSTHSVGCAGGKESMAPWQSKIDEVTWCDGLLCGTTSLDCKYMHKTTRQQANSWRWWVGELSQPFACELWVNHWLSKSKHYEICNSYFNVKVSCSRQTWVHSMLIFWVHVSWKVRVHAKSTGERFCSSTILRLRVGNSHVKRHVVLSFCARSRISSGKWSWLGIL